MNASDFITECETIFDRHLKPAQLPIYQDKLRRFSSEQLFELLNKVLEEVKSFPKVSEIHKAATELGFLQVDTVGFKPYRWKETDCKYCHGEGRVSIWWAVSQEDRPTGRVELQTLKNIVQYSMSSKYKPSPSEFESLFRCRCDAGDNLPKAWPKWTNSMSIQREVWL